MVYIIGGEDFWYVGCVGVVVFGGGMCVVVCIFCYVKGI